MLRTIPLPIDACDEKVVNKGLGDIKLSAYKITTADTL